MKNLSDARLQSWGRINPSRLKTIQAYAGKRVLDVGCSTGAYVEFLRRKNHSAFGLDLISDPEWLRNQVHTNIVASATDLPYRDQAFDTVLAFEVLEHVPNFEGAIDEMYRVAKKNIILSVPNSEVMDDLLGGGLVFSHWRDRTHINFFTFESLEELLNARGFRIEMIKGINPVRPEYILLRSYYFPPSTARILTAILRRIPIRRAYEMTILVVAIPIA